MTTKDVAQADLTRVGTGLDRVEDIFVEGELRNERLRASGDGRDNSDLMVQEKRANSKVNFIARRGLDPEVVAGGVKLAMVDDNSVLSIDSTVNGTSGKRRNASGRGITIAGDAITICVSITKMIEIEDALVISQKSVELEITTIIGGIGENLKLQITINAKARRNIDKVDLVVEIVTRWERDEVGGLVEGELEAGNSDETSVESPDSTSLSTDGVKVDAVLNGTRIGLAAGVSEVVKILIQIGITIKIHIKEGELEVLTAEIKAVELEFFGRRTVFITSGDDE